MRNFANLNFGMNIALLRQGVFIAMFIYIAKQTRQFIDTDVY